MLMATRKKRKARADLTKVTFKAIDVGPTDWINRQFGDKYGPCIQLACKIVMHDSDDLLARVRALLDRVPNGCDLLIRAFEDLESTERELKAIADTCRTAELRLIWAGEVVENERIARERAR
jgi:hypothetical protein